MAKRSTKNRTVRTPAQERASKLRRLGRPAGAIQQRVQKVGPQRFAIVAVDCAKHRCKWMLVDFYGRVLVEPTTVACNRGMLQLMTMHARDACDKAGISDVIVAVELTGKYHRPVVAAFRDAGFETREVHPFASKHFRGVSHPDLKTDDHDLEAIFQAAVNGFGLVKPAIDPDHQRLQILSRHRRNLVEQRARLMVQIRDILHQTMPGYAEVFSKEKFFEGSVAIPVARHFRSADEIRQATPVGIGQFLDEQQIRFRAETIQAIYSWAASAANPDPLLDLQHQVWCQLDTNRQVLTRQIDQTEQDMARFLVKTPYCLLLSVRGINVVLAAELAGEAGPIEYYLRSNSISGRAGLFPSRYQSDTVDHSGRLAKHANHRLRGVLTRIADCVSRHHPRYGGLAARWQLQKVHPRDWHCRIANRVSHLVFQLVSGRQVYHRAGVNPEKILAKLLKFHQEHGTSADDMSGCLNDALSWLPKSTYRPEAAQLQSMGDRRRSRRVTPIGDVIARLLLRLGNVDPSELESTTSEARG